MTDGEVMSIDARKLRFLLTPYVHLWDSLVVYEETQGVLYSSDLVGQPEDGPPDHRARSFGPDSSIPTAGRPDAIHETPSLGLG